MYVAQLVRVCSWRLATSGTFGSKFKCGRATYISSLGQGTNIQLPLSPECQFCPSSKYVVAKVHIVTVGSIVTVMVASA